MENIVDTAKDMLELKCHDDYKWASITITKLRNEVSDLVEALERIRDEPQASPRHAQVIAEQVLKATNHE